MILYPSTALSYIEKYRREVNSRYDKLRWLSETIIEMGYTEDDYGQYIEDFRKRFAREELSHSLTSFPERTEECEGLIKILQAFRNGKKNPDEKLLQSTTESMFIKYVYTSGRNPKETLEVIPKSRDAFNKRLDDLKSICLVLKDYGITDRDYQREYDKDIRKRSTELGFILLVGEKYLEEGAKLVEAIKEYGFVPYKSWWDRMFRKKQMDETLQAMLNRLLTLYVKTTTS